MKQDILEQFRSAMRAGKSREEIIAEMKRSGLTIVDAIKATRELFAVSLGDAKMLVSQHPDWIEVSTAASPFHESLITSFEDAAGNKLMDK